MRLRWVVFTCFLLASGAAGLFFLDLERQQNFPDLPPGRYIGILQGVTDLPKERLTWVIERASTENRVTVVVMSEGFVAQEISLQQDAESRRRTTKAFLPLQLKFGTKQFSFWGKSRGDQYVGQATADERTKASWTLSFIPPDQTPPGADILSRSTLEMDQWLDLKSLLLSLKHEQRLEEAAFEQKREYLEKLHKVIANEDLLLERANERRNEITNQVREAAKNQKELYQNVQAAVSDLDLLKRITKRGKAVTLARSVATRETKWYLANWKAAQDISGLEEYLGTSSGVDLKQLELAVRQASEVRALINEMNHEQQQIVELEARLNAPPEAVTVEPSEPKEERTKKKRKTLWDQLF